MSNRNKNRNKNKNYKQPVKKENTPTDTNGMPEQLKAVQEQPQDTESGTTGLVDEIQSLDGTDNLPTDTEVKDTPVTNDEDYDVTIPDENYDASQVDDAIPNYEATVPNADTDTDDVDTDAGDEVGRGVVPNYPTYSDEVIIGVDTDVAPENLDVHANLEEEFEDEVGEDIIPTAPEDVTLEDIQALKEAGVITDDDIGNPGDIDKSIEAAVKSSSGKSGVKITEEIFLSVDGLAREREEIAGNAGSDTFEPVIFQADLEEYPPANDFIAILNDFVKTSKVRPFVAVEVLVGIKYNLLVPITQMLQDPTSFLLAFKTIRASTELRNVLPAISAVTYKGRWKWSVDELMKIDLIISLASIYISDVKTNTSELLPNYGEQLRLVGASEAVISASRFIDQQFTNS